jgi:hypothetical protein
MNAMCRGCGLITSDDHLEFFTKERMYLCLPCVIEHDSTLRMRIVALYHMAVDRLFA